MKVHADNFASKEFKGRSASKYPYKDAVVEVDAYIGEIVKALDDAGVLDNTFIFVTSDNGPQRDQLAGQGLHAVPRRQGIGLGRRRARARHRLLERHDRPGRQSDELFDLMDLFNTSLHLAGAADQIPTDRYIDGIDQTSFLLADGGRSKREKVYIWNEKRPRWRCGCTSTRSIVKIVEAPCAVAEHRHDDGQRCRPRAVAVQPLHRSQGAISGRPPHECLPGLDGRGDEGACRDVQEISAEGHRVGTIARAERAKLERNA